MQILKQVLFVLAFILETNRSIELFKLLLAHRNQSMLNDFQEFYINFNRFFFVRIACNELEQKSAPFNSLHPLS